MKHRHHWQDWVFGVIGLWLIVSPWILGMTGAATWSMMALGALVVILGAIGLLQTEAQDWTDYAVAVVALLIIAAPWMVGFTAVAVASWNAVVCGIVLAVAALWSHLMPHEGGHA
ncbi:MAG: SPW repeat protein [Limimaricola soesokkakensis]|uniref:SPW repeat protein n=1 Tax=Limimaricola soesokkakensis TaxID=1343159 RepID=A0A1X6Z4M7_9RHOB|nr:SPW repeat protein [Limimaricola soesokkakensis]PSK86832.1 uncharacterized protein DUF2754 [Limimaricola soesokkakensis]SLN40891.1 SPW repeat protein [Limimaricola soesokkakensis]